MHVRPCYVTRVCYTRVQMCGSVVTAEIQGAYVTVRRTRSTNTDAVEQVCRSPPMSCMCESFVAGDTGAPGCAAGRGQRMAAWGAHLGPRLETAQRLWTRSSGAGRVGRETGRPPGFPPQAELPRLPWRQHPGRPHFCLPTWGSSVPRHKPHLASSECEAGGYRVSPACAVELAPGDTSPEPPAQGWGVGGSGAAPSLGLLGSPAHGCVLARAQNEPEPVPLCGHLRR